MTREEKEYYLIEYEPKFREVVKWLFGRENIDGLFPVYFVLYSYRHKLGISFEEDGMKGYKRGADSLQDRLYDASLMALGGDCKQFDYLCEVQNMIESLSRKKFDEVYTALIDDILCYTSLACGTQMYPNARIAHTAVNILKEHDCKTVYCAYSGIGVFAVACKGMKYTGAEPYAPANLIAEVICDAFGVKKKEFLTEDPIEEWTRRSFDGVVGNLPVDADFFNIFRYDHFLHKFNEKQSAFAKKILSKKTAKKTAVMLAHFEFANDWEYDGIRKEICEKGMLESVIALPEDIFRDALVPTYMIVLDMQGGHTKATFYDARKSKSRQNRYGDTINRNLFDMRDCVKDDEKVTVSYAAMEQASWSYNPSVYIQNAECRDGQELVRLGDIADIVVGARENGGRAIAFSELSDRFDKVYSGIVPSSFGNSCGPLIEGPSVLISLSRGVRREEHKIVCGICREPGEYRVDFFVTALKPKTDKILPEYLALALMTDSSFSSYYESIQEYYTNPVRWTHFLERRIPILTDMVEQKKAILDALGRADMASVTYNVILAGAGTQMQKYRNLLSKYGCSVLATVESVEGPGGLEEILRNMSVAGTSISKKAEAVIVDAGIKLDAEDNEMSFKGLDAALDFKLLYEGKGLSFFVTSSNSLDDIRGAGIISERRLRPVENGHFFMTKNGSPAEALASSLREELDRKLSPESRIRSRHKSAFEAAEWIDDNYSGREIHATEIISEFLMAAEEGVDTTRKLSDLRNVAHRVIEVLKDCRAVPPIDNGAIPRLLYDREYHNKDGKTYIQDVRIIDKKSLISSLIALIDIGNEGTHSFSGSANLGTAMLQTLLEFVTWFYDNREEFSTALTNYWHIVGETEYEDTWEEFSAPAEMRMIDGKPLWSCGNVHLFVPDREQDFIRQGEMVTVRKRSEEKKIKVPGIRFFAAPEGPNNREGYTIDKSGREDKI